MLKSYINPEENKEAKRLLPKLMVEGLLLGGSGLGVLALIFEIAADAFSVAAYQTLLAIHGAEGYHQVAIYAFIILSILLFLGIVPAYKAGAYLRPNAGGSGPLVEAIGPPKMRWLSWVGTSLFFVDAILTIIISSISAADVIMLIFPEFVAYRIVFAEIFAFFIMAVLVAVGPKKAVPLFLLGGGAFTIFTIVALSVVGFAAASNPGWSFISNGIVNRLQADGIVEHVVRAQQDLSLLTGFVFFKLLMASMSSAMLGFSGYEVIPASGKHAARPKWKVINTALTLAAVFLITTGVVQLFGAARWDIPATEGYSTLLIEYEIIAAQTLGNGIVEADMVPTDDQIRAAEAGYESYELQIASDGNLDPENHAEVLTKEEFVKSTSERLAFDTALNRAVEGTPGASFLFIAGVLLAIILLLAQGGGYIGGAAVAANAARLGRLPQFFEDDRVGIAVIWGISAVFIPIIREVVVVEAYYAFGFVSAFIITSTTVYFVRDDVLRSRSIEPGSTEARSLKFAGLRGMIASYIMGLILITQKSDALLVIIISGIIITAFQVYIANGGLKRSKGIPAASKDLPGIKVTEFASGVERAHDEARQRGLVDALNALIGSDLLPQYNVAPSRIRRMVSYLYNIDEIHFEHEHNEHDHHIEEPSEELQETYQAARDLESEIADKIEWYSRFGTFIFINAYHLNWISDENDRTAEDVQRAMVNILFPAVEHDEIWEAFKSFEFEQIPEPIWQFSRERYHWAKDQWPNLSDRITTIWTLQDFGLIDKDIDIVTVVSVAEKARRNFVQVTTKSGTDLGDSQSVSKSTID
ncbi:MAG: hypothetical protein ACI9EW_000551 [Cellvibrionaceae bacterium]|jgi:hypothetical protein